LDGLIGQHCFDSLFDGLLRVEANAPKRRTRVGSEYRRNVPVTSRSLKEA